MIGFPFLITITITVLWQRIVLCGFHQWYPYYLVTDLLLFIDVCVSGVHVNRIQIVDIISIRAWKAGG